MSQMNRQITGIILAYSSKDQEKVLTFVKNSFKVYPRSNITFNLLPHIGLDEEHKCIIDNLWISFSQIFNHQTNKNLDRKYFITCLNCLLEYFHKKNNSDVNFSYYVIYQGHKTCIFKTWEEVFPHLSNHPIPFFKGFYNLTVTPQTRGSVDYPSTCGIQVDVGLPDATLENRAESPLYGELYPNTTPA